MARLLVVGLIITIVVLGINYFTAIRRNTETSRELSRVMFELGNVSKKLDVEIKRNSEMIADLHKHEIKMKEKITSLNAELSAAKNDMKVYKKLSCCCDSRSYCILHAAVRSAKNSLLRDFCFNAVRCM